MNIGRSGHTFTLLPNSRNILAVGSRDFIDGYTAEIYDIETGKWAFVPGIMNTIRTQHTATLLRNGQVLIVGGLNVETSMILSSVELYIPSLNTFITTGSLNTARDKHTAILLKDGLSVLVIGGSDFTQARPEIYVTGSWFHTSGDMIYRRAGGAGVLLPDGNVLVAGGTDSNNTALSSVEIYNTITGTFSLVQSMECARSQFTLTLLPSGQVLAVGGKGSATDKCLRISELYDPIIDQWMSTRLLSTLRCDHNAILINNSVLIVGGYVTTDWELIRACERYNL
jgi:N-acetylneuraminic acid mutarotase